MNKILKINLKDVIYDCKNVSDILNKACSRTSPMYVAGGFKFGDNLIFCLDEILKDETVDNSYIITPISSLSEDGIIGEISERYTNGFLTIFCFELNDKIWGVFSKKRLENNII